MENGSGGSRPATDAGSREGDDRPSLSSRWSDTTAPRTTSETRSNEGEIRRALAEWLTNFSPGVAHRLRNELMILMNSEYGLRQLRDSEARDSRDGDAGAKPDPREAWIESARSSINRAVQLCESLCEVGLARARRGVTTVDCVKLIRAATTLAEHTYMKRGFKIETVLPEQRVAIESDPEFVREVALGLVQIGLPDEEESSNSCDPGQTARTIRVGVRGAHGGGAQFFLERAAGSRHPDEARVRDIASMCGAEVECVEGERGSDRLQVTVFDRPANTDGESSGAARS